MKQTRLHLTKTHVTFYAVLIFLTAILTNCQSAKYYPEPEKQIIKELSSRKIIMLGDFDHAAAYPCKSLIALLNEWREQVRTGDSKDKDITLVLEEDDEVINLIKSFISSGDIQNAFKYWSPINSLETLEFYYDLRSFVKSVDSLNSKLNSESKISFTIIGGEMFNTFNNLDFLKKSQEEKGRFSVGTRDSLISQKIISHLEKKPQGKAIVFYGSAHLWEYLSDKRSIVGNIKSGTMGYYLAHHLKEHFGKEEVLTVNQRLVANQGMLKNTQFENVTERTFLVKSKDMDGEKSNVDRYIFRREPSTPPHSLGQYFSKNTVNECLEKMKKFKPDISIDVIKSCYTRTLEALKLITGQNYSEIADWEKWIKKSDYDGFKRLDSPEFAQMIEDEYFAQGNASVKKQLLMLGVSREILLSPLLKDEWKKVWSNKILPDIKFVNAIGVNMIGTADEQIKAKQYLISVCGKDFQNPVDYIEFHRSMVYDVSY